MSSPPAAQPEPFGPEEFAAKTGVSRETLARLKAYAGMLADWNTRHNLVSKASMEEVWQRHICDSAQLAPLIPGGTKTLVDLGSGAGFPGLVLSVLLQGSVGVTLYESTGKKAEFQVTLKEIKEKKTLSDELKKMMDKAITEFKGTFKK